jgi:bacillolysin
MCFFEHLPHIGGVMKFFSVIACILLAVLAASPAFGGEERIYGPNLLRGNSAISRYLENDRGIPLYVEGQLSAQPAAKGNEIAAAMVFFEANRGAYKMIQPTEELIVNRVSQDDLGMTHVRLRQTYRNIPVIGAEMIVHFSPEGELKTVNGTYHNDIELDVTPSVDAARALEVADADLRSFFGAGTAQTAELVVFPWEGKFFLAWHTFLLSDTPMGRWEYFIDAKTGAVIYKANRIMNANDIGTGYGVMGTARTHIDTDYNGSLYQMIDKTRRAANNPHGHNGQMPSGNDIRTNTTTTSLPGTLATDADNVWDVVATQRPAVDGQVYTGLVYDWWLTQFNRNGYNGSGASMLTVVNYSAEGDNNAYWDGQRIVIWSWSSGWRSLAGCPDVIAHEWGHAVTENCSNLIYEKEPGALNESFSDMMGAAFEWAYPDYDTPDWGMGENGRTTGVPFRSMSDPHLYSDPDYYGTTDPYWVNVTGCTPSSYNDYCGVHTNSGVGNKWFFLLSDGGTHHSITVTGINVANAIKVAYRANAEYWTSSTDYAQAALGTISAANDLDPTGAWATQVSKAWNAVGVATPGPDLVFSYPNGMPSSLIPAQPTSIEVVISGTLGGSLVAGSPKIYYSLNGGAYTTAALTQLTTSRYRGTLPAADCRDRYDFYFSADEATTGTHFDHDSATAYFSIVSENTTTVFADSFNQDKGWTVSGDAATGQWERGVPAGNGDRGDPATDFDGSGYCYLTGNTYGDSDVDGGTTYLTSPVIDLSIGGAMLHYARWYSNDYGADPHNDVMKVYISNNNGGSWTLVETVGPTDQASGGWYEKTFWSADYVPPTNQTRLRFEVSDLGSGSVVEAAIDAISVIAYECGSVPPHITADSLPTWTAGHPYSQTLTASGGSGMLNWTDKNGDLAGTGLTLASSGLLSGTVASAGSVTFTAKVTDDQSQSDEKQYTVIINGAISITTVSVPDWTAGYLYSTQLTAVGGTGAGIWSDKNSALVGSGLTLSTAGLLSGTPTSARSISLTARVVDQVGAASEHLFVFIINPAISITTLSAPAWTVNQPYSLQLVSTGGTGAVSWTDKNAGLPGTGLTLSSTGYLSGTPTTVGSISFTARVVDQVGAASERLFTVVINPAVSIATLSAPDWTINRPYSLQLASTGGTGPMTWTDKDAELPGTGLTVSTSGLLSGTPTTVGEIHFTAHVTDQAGADAERFFLLTINPTVTITSGALPVCSLGVAYNAQLTATGGTGTITWSDRDGSLEGTGLALSSSGVLSGTASEAAVRTFTAKAVDAAGSVFEKPLEITIVRPYECGDANGDHQINVADAVYIIAYVFRGGPAPTPVEAGDATCNGTVNVADAVYIIAYVFRGGPAPCCP